MRRRKQIYLLIGFPEFASPTLSSLQKTKEYRAPSKAHDGKWRGRGIRVERVDVGPVERRNDGPVDGNGLGGPPSGQEGTSGIHAS